MNKLIKLTVLFLFFIQFGYSQLNVFTLNVTKTDETCTGNGSLTFNVSNTSAGATIIYSIYLFPNLISPITTLTTNTFTGLSNGNYRVVALQSLGNLSNSQQQDIVINNLIVPLVYNIVGQSVSCQTTGQITVNVTQGTPVTYEIISGPVIVSPQTSNIFANLIAGSYNIRVNDGCGDGVVQSFTVTTIINNPNFTVLPISSNCELVNCNTMAVSFLITANLNTTLVYPLSIVFTVFPPNNGAAVIVNQIVTSGSSSEQTINLNISYFENQNYNYSIKVTDGCMRMLTTPNFPILKKLTLSLSQQPTNSCTKQIILNLCNFVAPYSVTFLSSPSSFNPLNFNSTHPGPFLSSSTVYASTITIEIPNGNYVISVTDACGRTAQSQINVIKSLPDYVISPSGNVCNPTYTVFIPNTGPPINTLFLTQAPPILNYIFPYNLTSQIVNGYFSMVLISGGTYTFTGTNVCGDSFLFDVIIPPLAPPTITATGFSNVGCATFNGSLNIAINGGPTLVTVTLLQAPSNYVGTLPQNVSQFIVHPLDKNLFLQNIPIGNYVFSITDSCGNNFNPINVNIPVNTTQPQVLPYFLKGCDLNFSSLRLNIPNGFLQQVIITSAPPSFLQALPYDISFNINSSNGALYMNTLPEGNYTFFSKDTCNNEKISIIFIQGYTVTNNINVQANCGSFNLEMQHLVNEIFIHTYWLQKLNPITNQWGNPYTNVIYTAGLPTVLNSYQLQNLATNYNIAVTGTFRIIKSHYQYENGFPTLLLCNDVIKTFDFNGGLRIISANTFPCSNGINEVIVTAEGVAPLQFKIISKNGVSFVVNNGTSNIFTGLEPAVYKFQVTDVCGGIVNRIFDITLLPEPTITPVNLCEGQNGQLSVQAISYLNYQWWKGTDTATILSTTNVLNFNPFSTTTTPGTYYVRIYSTNPLSCANKIISYVVPNISNPNAGLNREINVCNSTSPLDLFSVLIAPFDTGGTWTETTTSGNLNGNIWSPIGINYGTYIFKYLVSGFCGTTDEAVITLNFNEGPPIPIISSIPEICTGDILNLAIPAVLNATYLWTGPNNFTSNNQNVVINNAQIENSGLYIVKVILNGCETSSDYAVNINPFPKFEINSGCLNSVFTLNVVPIENSFNIDEVSYNWTGPNGFSSTSNTVNLSGLPIGIYQVTVTNSFNCSLTREFNVINTLCSIPNVITPNGDFTNEYLELSGLDVTNIQIFSRWGRLVYEKNNYINEWNGQNMNGGKLPDATYYYFIKLNSGKEFYGWILLVNNTN